MRLLASTLHPDISPEKLQDASIKRVLRRATRGIIIRNDEILMLYTKRYHDYSLPGGGIDEGEDNIQGLIRELREETGAKNVRNIQEFGCYEEYRPWYKEDIDIMQMQSFCYVCDIDEELDTPELEHHEIQNGMHPVWMNIHAAIAHNEETMASSPKKGLSIVRETFLLKRILEELV
ncbi:MAG: NUDIX hydrolase [Marinomonas sp.]|uniref:NUDIX hydrolase n=1 Tax=unclassified Marinomonas TaxID=196814 RepID=UPI0007AF2A5C|nr:MULTISPECIES: NUDIX hydrolase [unclassified Marinomonas]KZM44921.1 DNA mismatch repair protein MutT [Marinomonas sp. SBI22]KZM46620.1 DNA mismatch repair protein MutT [Marinomonas sp. SBI8L]